jgi:hypothetical protein
MHVLRKVMVAALLLACGPWAAHAYGGWWVGVGVGAPYPYYSRPRYGSGFSFG